MADLNIETQGADSASASSSDSVALTPEQRDDETIARLLGTDKAETPSQDADKGDAETDATATGEAEGSESAGDEADDKGESGADEDDLPEVTDEELEAIVDALDERLLTHPRLQKAIEDKAKADADRRYEERRKSESVSQESERLIGQGRKAVENVYNLFTRLNGNLDKAIKGEEVGDDFRVDPDTLMTELGAFGAAAVAEARRDANTAFADAFREGATLGGTLTDDEKEKVVGIVQTAQRIANDPKQGSSASVAYLMQENVKFLVERAKAAGRAEAQAEFTKKRDALKKVTGENGTRAAVAKIANARKNLPTKPPATPAQETQGKATMEAYREAKRSGDYARADAIAAAMGQ